MSKLSDERLKRMRSVCAGFDMTPDASAELFAHIEALQAELTEVRSGRDCVEGEMIKWQDQNREFEKDALQSIRDAERERSQIEAELAQTRAVLAVRTLGLHAIHNEPFTSQVDYALRIGTIIDTALASTGTEELAAIKSAMAMLTKLIQRENESSGESEEYFDGSDALAALNKYFWGGK